MSGDDLSWLPEELPANVRLIVSAGPGLTFEQLQKRKWPCLEVGPLRTKDRELLLAGYLASFAKKLSPTMVQAIVRKPVTSSPLYLRTLAEELRVFGRHEELQGQIVAYLGADDVRQLFDRLLARLERDYEDERLGLCGTALLCWHRRGRASPRPSCSTCSVTPLGSCRPSSGHHSRLPFEGRSWNREAG